MRTAWIAWALTLGFALTATAGVGMFVGEPAASTAPRTQDGVTDGGMGDVPIADVRPGDATLGNRTGSVTIGLVVRWGYLDDPAVAALEGGWQWNDTRTGGDFRGHWQLAGRRVGGDLRGQFALPDDGHGRFRGEWNVTGSDVHGFLWGAWVRADRGRGFFDGMWNVSDGRQTGAVGGTWAALSERGGEFRGRAIAAPSMAPVDWDGDLHTSAGGVQVVRTVRWETGGERRFGSDDQVLPQRDRQTAAWRSTTTVNWDGLVFAVTIPKERPVPQVTLHTAQIDFTWNATDLPGLHLRRPVDRLGHEIEVRGFLVRDRDDRCDGRHVRMEVGIRWGVLDRDGNDRTTDGRDVTVWDGFAQVTDGGLGVLRTLSFERGDYLLPRDNRLTVEWKSATSGGWDGVVLEWLIPLDAVEEAHFTLHAGTFSHVFSLRELEGVHVFDAEGGNQVEVRGVRA